MTSATKRKHVVKEMLENLDLPESHQTIVKVICIAYYIYFDLIVQKNEFYSRLFHFLVVH